MSEPSVNRERRGVTARSTAKVLWTYSGINVLIDDAVEGSVELRYATEKPIRLSRDEAVDVALAILDYFGVQ